MSSIGVNDILCLKIRYPDGEISTKNHYYLITEEIKGEVNTCINKDSYIDKRKEIRIEKYSDLQKYKVNNPISIRAIKNITEDCIKFMAEHNILDINKVSILKDEIESINGNTK